MTVRVLSVCSHNRARSVLIGALLTKHAASLGADVAVTTAGFSAEGLPPTARVADALTSMGLDPRHHSSRRISADAVERADLVITAERRHVVDVAGAWPQSFTKTMTLPEIVARADAAAARGVPMGGGLRTWLRTLNAERPTALDYLDANDIGEIPDPTGEDPSGFRACVHRIDLLTHGLALHLALEVGLPAPDGLAG